MIGVPEGFTEVRIGPTRAIVRTDLEPALRPLLASRGTLLGSEAGARGEAPRLVVDGAPALRVRRYHRGGFMSGLLGDLHLSRERSCRELVALLRARRLGVPVPEPVAAVSAHARGAFVRHELATIEVPFATPLPEVLVACDARARREWLRRTASVVARLHAAGIAHADLHAGNLLASRDEVVLLDLDRCELGVTARRRHADLARLYRSVAKSERLREVLTRTDLLRFVDAYRGAGGDVDARRLARGCARTVWWHSWMWGGGARGGHGGPPPHSRRS